MFESWITRKHDRVRLTSSPLSSHLLSFAERMEADGYRPRTLRRYLFAGEAFGRWLVQQGCPIEHVDEARLRLHIASVGRQRLKGRARGRLPVAASGVRKLVEVLRAQGTIPPTSAPCMHSPMDECIAAFEQHLSDVAGLAIGTRRGYIRFAQALLAARSASGEPDWLRLDADFV